MGIGFGANVSGFEQKIPQRAEQPETDAAPTPTERPRTINRIRYITEHTAGIDQYYLNDAGEYQYSRTIPQDLNARTRSRKEEIIDWVKGFGAENQNDYSSFSERLKTEPVTQIVNPTTANVVAERAQQAMEKKQEDLKANYGGTVTPAILAKVGERMPVYTPPSSYYLGNAANDFKEAPKKMDVQSYYLGNTADNFKTKPVQITPNLGFLQKNAPEIQQKAAATTPQQQIFDNNKTFHIEGISETASPFSSAGQRQRNIEANTQYYQNQFKNWIEENNQGEFSFMNPVYEGAYDFGVNIGAMSASFVNMAQTSIYEDPGVKGVITKIAEGFPQALSEQPYDIVSSFTKPIEERGLIGGISYDVGQVGGMVILGKLSTFDLTGKTPKATKISNSKAIITPVEATGRTNIGEVIAKDLPKNDIKLPNYEKGIGYNQPDAARVKSISSIIGSKEMKLQLESESTSINYQPNEKVYFDDVMASKARKPIMKFNSGLDMEQLLSPFQKLKPKRRFNLLNEVHDPYVVIREDELSYVRNENTAGVNLGGGGYHNPAVEANLIRQITKNTWGNPINQKNPSFSIVPVTMKYKPDTMIGGKNNNIISIKPQTANNINQSTKQLYNFDQKYKPSHFQNTYPSSDLKTGQTPSLKTGQKIDLKLEQKIVQKQKLRTPQEELIRTPEMLRIPEQFRTPKKPEKPKKPTPDNEFSSLKNKFDKLAKPKPKSSPKSSPWYPASLENVTYEEFTLGGKGRATHIATKKITQKYMKRLAKTGQSIPTLRQSKQGKKGFHW